MYGDEDTSGAPYGEAVKFDVQSLCGAIEYDARMDCGSEALQRTVCEEVVDNQEGSTASDH